MIFKEDGWVAAPSCRHDTIGSYHTEALMLDMWYDLMDHTFNGHDQRKVVCADTFEVLKDGAIDREILRRLSERHERISAGELGFRREIGWHKNFSKEKLKNAKKAMLDNGKNGPGAERD